MTILMGVVANFPFAIAAGLGLNTLVAVSLAPMMTWPAVMGLVLVNGIVVLLLVVTGVRTMVFNAVPQPLKGSIAVGIGLFIALVGLVDAGFVRRVPDAAGTTVPVQLGIGPDGLSCHVIAELYHTLRFGRLAVGDRGTAPRSILDETEVDGCPRVWTALPGLRATGQEVIRRGETRLPRPEAKTRAGPHLCKEAF